MITAEQMQQWKAYCDKWAQSYADQVIAKEPLTIYGREPNLREIYKWDIATSEARALEAYGLVCTTLSNEGPVNPNSGDPTGANENMGDANMQTLPDGKPGFIWYGGTDKNGVKFRCAICSPQMRATMPRNWMWRNECVFEVEGNRYNYAISEILPMMASGIVNPSGK
jgi:hypothetical protein